MEPADGAFPSAGFLVQLTQASIVAQALQTVVKVQFKSAVLAEK